MKASPAFQFYPSDFIMGTITMSAAEVGGYIRLLCFQWDNGPIPDDLPLLHRLTGCDGIALATIRQKFDLKDGKLSNKRLEAVRSSQAEYRERQRENAQKRWVGNAKPHAVAKPTHMPEGMPKRCSPTPTPTPTPTPNSDSKTIAAKAARERNPEFDALCLFEGIPLGEVGAAGGRIAKALKDIRQSTPGVSAEEIALRGKNYTTHFPTASRTAVALAKHWGKCHEPNGVKPATIKNKAGWL